MNEEKKGIILIYANRVYDFENLLNISVGKIFASIHPIKPYSTFYQINLDNPAKPDNEYHTAVDKLYETGNFRQDKMFEIFQMPWRPYGMTFCFFREKLSNEQELIYQMLN